MELGRDASDYSSGTPVLINALFLDLDGTVRKSKTGEEFIKDENDIMLMPGIEEILHKYEDAGWIILGVSNQGGIAHGFKNLETMEKELYATVELFEKNPFWNIQVCPFEPNGSVEPYNHRSLARKPNIGMLCEAEKNAWIEGFIIDWDNSIMVGDRPEDEGLAKNAEMKFHYIDEFLTMEHNLEVKA